jgi:GNAT superfamily N-acetyltransferase
MRQSTPPRWRRSIAPFHRTVPSHRSIAPTPHAVALHFKIADDDAEFEAIHRLNYATFVDEIPQHAPNEMRRLVDRFHAQNTYLICLAGGPGGALAGMLALRTQRPFSLDAKLPDLDAFLPPGACVGEVRLLAVAPAWRGTPVLAGLAQRLERECHARGLDLLIVSATTRQRRLYRHFGFDSFGPRVGTAGAQFQPMQLHRARFEALTPAAAWRHAV